MTREPGQPPERGQTAREALRELLRVEALTARELSERVRLPEREVAGHLAHLQRSARARGEELVIDPSRCLGCGFVFRERDRLTKPGSCPSCRATRIAPPRFRLEPRG